MAKRQQLIFMTTAQQKSTRCAAMRESEVGGTLKSTLSLTPYRLHCRYDKAAVVLMEGAALDNSLGGEGFIDDGLCGASLRSRAPII